MLENQSEILVNEIDKKEIDLVDKIESLEQKVLDVVEETTSTVQETVEVAKETIDHTVEAVQSTMGKLKETFNLRKQVDRHPWSMLAASASAGFAFYHVVGPSRRNVVFQRRQAQDTQAQPARQTSLGVFGNVMVQSLAPIFQGLLAGLCGELVHVLAGRPAKSASATSYGPAATQKPWQSPEMQSRPSYQRQHSMR